MTYTQHGIAAYLEAHLAHAKSSAEKFFYVATDVHGHPLGYAEFRVNSPTECFLSYVCVTTDARGRGVATGLIEHFCSTQASTAHLELDVFHDNVVALRLYATLGLTTTDMNAWICRHLPTPSSELRVSQLATSVAAYAVHGFCEFQVEWEGREIRLGRIGPGILRCFDAGSFEDEGLLAGARATFEGVTQALTIVPSSDVKAVPSYSQILAVSNRMKGTIGAIMERSVGNA